MRNLTLFFILSFFTLPLTSQAIIECPSDVTIHVFDLDEDYESYGEPTVTSNESYTVDKNVTVVENNCEGNYVLLTSIVYQALGDNGNVQAECTQVISVERATFDDVTFPEDYEIDEGEYSDLDPINAGYPLPFENLNNYTIITTYEDQLLNTQTGLKVIRTWTVLDWCTGETLEDFQVLKIGTITSANFGGVLFSTCNNGQVGINNLTLKTDAPGFTMDYSGCNIENGDYLSYLNCVAANNDIPANNNFFVEVEGLDDALNGVSTLDLVMIMRHILALDTFDDQSSIIAADANNDQRVSAIDLVELRKLILGIYKELPQSPSWKFFNEQLEIDGFNASDSNDLKFGKQEFPLAQLNIIGIKIGDLNCSTR